MDKNMPFEQSAIIAGPPLMGIEANWSAHHPEDTGIPYYLPFAVKGDGQLSMTDSKSQEGSQSIDLENKIIGIAVDDYTPRKTDSGESVIDIIGDGIEVPLGELEPKKLGRVAVLNYNPDTGEGTIIPMPDQAATEEE